MSGPILRRVPFSPGDAEVLIPFCAVSGSVFDAAAVRRFLLELTSAPRGVTILADAAGPVLVATVIDRIENGADAANLEILGVRPAISAEAFARDVVEPSIDFARAGVRRALHVALHACLSGVEDAERTLAAAGFVPSYVFFTMSRSEGTPRSPSPGPLPPGWRWTDVDAVGAVDAHAVLAAAFRGQPGFGLSPVADFVRSVAGRTSAWRALLDGEVVAGLVQTVLHSAEGELRTVARAPTHRGRGLGPLLVAEGLRALAAGGARTVELSVEANNERALDLYRRFGFEVSRRTPVLALQLR
jgi:ribosomal protein S18 acetylase RimI-like enzyme